LGEKRKKVGPNQALRPLGGKLKKKKNHNCVCRLIAQYKKNRKKEIRLALTSFVSGGGGHRKAINVLWKALLWGELEKEIDNT